MVVPEWAREYQGRMEACSGTGKATGDCGETIEMYLLVREGTVRRASFFSDGCVSSKTAAAAAARLAQGRPVDEVPDIRAGEITKGLEDFPKEEEHCAGVAAAALGRAVDDYYKREIAAAKRPGQTLRPEEKHHAGV